MKYEIEEFPEIKEGEHMNKITSSAFEIKLLQERSPWSVTEICKRAAISRAGFYDVKRGRFRLKGKKLVSLLKALDANPQTVSKIVRLTNSERNFDRTLKPMKAKIKNNDVGYSYIKLDEKTKAMLSVLVKCAEETFNTARVVDKKETLYLCAAQYINNILKQKNDSDQL
jgi:hypothetical protein